MAKIVITITDEDDGSVACSIDSGKVHAGEQTPAERMAFIMLDALSGDDENDELLPEEDVIP